MALQVECQGCGLVLINVDVFDSEYEHCKNYCCGCCPSKDGFKGEACQQDFIKRKRGEPVGIMATLDQF